MDEPHVVFILSTNYAGSHLLAQLLSAHSLCAGVGELHNYRKYRERGPRSGNVLDDYLAHPDFAGLDALVPQQWHATILRRLRRSEPALTHLIDNSKRPAWARRFRHLHTHPIHLLRDPRALASRWLGTYATPAAERAQRRRVLRRRPWRIGSVNEAVDVYVEKWLIANGRITRYLRNREAPIVSYRDLTLATREVLERVMPAIGLEFEPAQLRYGRQRGALGTRKRDYLEASEQSAIAIDLRWQADLDEAQRRRIEAHAGLRRYLEQVGLVLTDEGLTRLHGEAR